MSGKRRQTPFEKRLAESRKNPEFEKAYSEMKKELSDALIGAMEKKRTKNMNTTTTTNIRLSYPELEMLLGFLHSVCACEEDECVEWTDEDKAAAETLYTRLNAGTLAS